MNGLIKMPNFYLWIGGLLACCFSCSSVVAAESVAMVTDLKGAASIVSTSKTRPVAILSEVKAGAEIRLDKDCQLTFIYMKSGNEFQLTGPAQVAVGVDEPKLLSGAAIIRKASFLNEKTAKLDTKGGQLIQGAIRMRSFESQGIKLQTPAAKVLQAPPAFLWTDTAAGEKYVFRLHEDGSNDLLVEAQVTGHEYQLQKNIQLYPGRTYIWSVDIDRGNGNVESRSAEFILATEEDKKHFAGLKLKSDASFSDRILYAALLEQANFREEAKKIWKELSSERPESAELKYMLAK